MSKTNNLNPEQDSKKASIKSKSSLKLVETSSETALQSPVITVDGQSYNLPVIDSTIGPKGLDLSQFYKESGYFTYDPGFMSTASCKSTITYIDGDQGILLYRGHSIENIAFQHDFVSVIYLLLFGVIPHSKQRDDFEKRLVSAMKMPQEVSDIIHAFSKDSHPMAVAMGALSYLASVNHTLYNSKDEEKIDDYSIQVIASTITIGCYAFRHINNKQFIEPDESLSFIENFSRMMFGSDIKNIDAINNAFNKLLILHADHEQNASTSTVRMVASTEVNLYASVIAGFSALWGPLHGGANEAVIRMLQEIGNVSRVGEFVAKAKDKNSSSRLMGFGHRVYKNYDPRAAVIKSAADEILEKFGDTDNELLQIAMELEKTALNDEYFIKRKLFPNVDFYSGIIYKAMGIRPRFFTVMFAMGRVAGWVAQAKELLLSPERKIARPRQVYLGMVDEGSK